MSLDFDFTRCEDTDYLYQDDIWPYTQSIIFATMAVGIGDLSEKNYPEFVARLTIWSRIIGANYDSYPDELIRKMIGLRTNVSFETRTQWIKRIVSSEMDDIVRNAKRELING